MNNNYKVIVEIDLSKIEAAGVTNVEQEVYEQLNSLATTVYNNLGEEGFLTSPDSWDLTAGPWQNQSKIGSVRIEKIENQSTPSESSNDTL